jgi:tetratricopeptide (TPR) repeat protein
VDQTPETKSPLSSLSPATNGNSDGASTESTLLSELLKVSGDVKVGLGAFAAGNSLDMEPCVPSVSLLPALLPAEIESAEGYIELVTQPAVRLGVNHRFRRSYAKRALALALSCGSRTVDPKHEARRQMVIGQSHRLLKRYRAATTAFRKASKCRLVRVEALQAMGWCQKRSGQVDLAVVSLTRALAISPDNAALHYNLACYLACLSQHRAAIYELAWALELEPRLRNRALAEPDFDELRPCAAFSALTAARTPDK